MTVGSSQGVSRGDRPPTWGPTKMEGGGHQQRPKDEIRKNNLEDYDLAGLVIKDKKPAVPRSFDRFCWPRCDQCVAAPASATAYEFLACAAQRHGQRQARC